MGNSRTNVMGTVMPDESNDNMSDECNGHTNVRRCSTDATCAHA